MENLNGKIEKLQFSAATTSTDSTFNDSILTQTSSPPRDIPSPNSNNSQNTTSKKQKKSIVPVSGLCTKCNGKRRHTRTCPFRKREEEEEIMFTSQQIISRLDIAALKRYKKHFRLKTRHNISKAELVTAVKQHYDTIQLNEIETIESFLDKAKHAQTL